MQTRFLGRVCAALVAISLLAVPGTALADDAGPVEWAGWISDSLQGLAVDYFATKEQLDNATWLPATIGSWSVEYVTSQEMAKDVRSLPEYQALYGSNPWDSSAAIRSYDGGELVSILTPEGLYNAWMWLHGGVPPYDDAGSGGSSPLPTGSHTFVIWDDSLASSYTFSDGRTLDFSRYQSDFDNAFAKGMPVLCGFFTDSSGAVLTYVYPLAIGDSSQRPVPVDCGFTVGFNPLANSLGFSNSTVGINTICAASGYSQYRYSGRGFATTSNSISSRINDGNWVGPVGWYYSTWFAGNSAATDLYIVVSSGSQVWTYDRWTDGQAGPAPAPDPVYPVAPSSPSVDAPQSDGPVQTDVNITVTLPDGSTTVVVAPSADLQPVVQWLSIINANIVAWGGNISQWLAEIWKTLDAFRMAVDNWSVSILSAIDSLGNVVPSFDSNETNYWNTVVTYNNDVWGTARNIGQQDIQNDLERLKGKFPFSIPWDLFAILLLFDADPVAPVLDIPLVYYDGSVTSENIHVDLSAFDSVMSLWRRLSLVGFVFALAVATRRLLSYVTVANDLVFG